MGSGPINLFREGGLLDLASRETLLNIMLLSRTYVLFFWLRCGKQLDKVVFTGALPLMKTLLCC